MTDKFIGLGNDIFFGFLKKSKKKCLNVMFFLQAIILVFSFQEIGSILEMILQATQAIHCIILFPCLLCVFKHFKSTHNYI